MMLKYASLICGDHKRVIQNFPLAEEETKHVAHHKTREPIADGIGSEHNFADKLTLKIRSCICWTPSIDSSMLISETMPVRNSFF